MLIKELKRHFPARTPEWTNAVTMFAWGVYILLHPGIFEGNPIYQGFIDVANAWAPSTGPMAVARAENLWGLVTVCVGWLRASALFVNGAYGRTPMIRLFTSAVSAFVWFQIVLGLMRLDVPSTGIVIYSSAVCLDLLSAYRAGCDAAMSELTRRGNSGAVTRGKHSEYSAGSIL